MTASRRPLTDAYLAGGGDLESAAAELIALMPLHGGLYGPDGPATAEEAARGRLLEARMRALLAERRRAQGGG